MDLLIKHFDDDNDDDDMIMVMSCFYEMADLQTDYSRISRRDHQTSHHRNFPTRQGRSQSLINLLCENLA